MSLASTPAPVREDNESNGQVTPAGPAIVGSGFDASCATTPIVMALGMASIFADVFKQVPSCVLIALQLSQSPPSEGSAPCT